MTFNEKLMQALSEDYDERMSLCTAKEKDHKFSLAYRLWEHKFLRDLHRKRCNNSWTIKRARKCVNVMLSVAMLFVLMGCAIVGTTIGRYAFNNRKTYSELFLEEHPSDKTRIEEYYGLPEEEGWEVVSFEELTGKVCISYKRGDKKIIFIQNIIQNNMGIVNTENAVAEPVSIYENEDGFFIALNGESDYTLYWIYDGYLFNISGNFNKSELINLAHSTKIVDF